MSVVMVKKRLVTGEACGKCAQTEEMLRRRGLWELIDDVVWAVEDDPNSEGARLAQRFDVALAPFFVVEAPGAQTQIYTRTLKLIKEVLKPLAAAQTAEPTISSPQDPSRDLDRWEASLDAASPLEIVRQALDYYGERCAIAFSGAEDVLLIDLASQTGLPFSVFCLDTGRLYPETYAFIDRVRRHYGIEIDIVSPQAEPLRAFVRQKGLFSFLDDGHKECCGIRKIEPLGRALADKRAWITGQRQDQSPTRADVSVLQADGKFSFQGQPLTKFNPLARWSSAQVWAHIRANDIPFNPLHQQGFPSIGCQPCTRAVHPGQHEREGRWWWEDATKRECGLHLGPKTTGT